MVGFLPDAVIHFSSAFVDALDKAHRTGGIALARATSITGRIEPLRRCTSPTTRASRSCPCSMVSIAVEKRAKSLSPGTPRSARSPRIRFTRSGVKPSLLPTSRPLFHTRRLGARFLAMAFRSDVWFLPIARDIEADPNGGFTIARIIWQGWQHHEAPPRSD